LVQAGASFLSTMQIASPMPVQAALTPRALIFPVNQTAQDISRSATGALP